METKENGDQAIRLTPLRASDQPRLFELMTEIYPPAYSHFWEDEGAWYLDLCYNGTNLQKELNRPHSHYFFIEYQRQTAGILKYDFPFSPRQIHIPNAMKLHRLYLKQSFHGKGLAGKIMQLLEEIAQAEKLDFIWLEAMEKQEQAKRFYQKMGYKQVHQYRLDFERFLPGFEEILIYSKTLSIQA